MKKIIILFIVLYAQVVIAESLTLIINYDKVRLTDIAVSIKTDVTNPVIEEPEPVQESTQEPTQEPVQVPDIIDINLDTAYQGTISVSDEVDKYKFDIEPNKRYYILVWADNTFNTNHYGLKDTSITAYLNKGNEQVKAYFNNDAPIWMNMGYGSRLIIEAVPSGVTPVRVTQCIAPSSVTFSIEQEDLAPETGTYSFKVLVDEMPKNAFGIYDYTMPMQSPLITGAVNPPDSVIKID